MATRKRKKKPSKRELDKRLGLITKYKWEFLRRNEKYVQACEKWSNRSRGEWDDGEVIISYPYGGRLTDFKKLEYEQLANPIIQEYWDLYGGEMQALSDDLFFMADIERKGFKPKEFHKQGSWRPFFEEWEINMPLNPNIKVIPCFIRISPKLSISQPSMKGVKNNVFVNDVWLEHGTASFVEVNWAYPKQYLVRQFEKMVENKTKYLKAIGRPLKDSRARFDKFDYYLQVWDMRRKRKLSAKKIADELAFLDAGGKYDADILRALDSCEDLINGGYKTIDLFV